MMQVIDQLAAVQKISELRARYFRALDTKDWTAFAGIFTADAVADGREGFAARAAGTGQWTANGPPDLVTAHLSHLDIDGMMVSGGAEIAEKARSLFPSEIITVHQGHMGEITFESAIRATGIWAMEDRLLYPDGFAIRELQGFGHYHDRYRLEQGHWKIAGFRLTRLRVDIR